MYIICKLFFLNFKDPFFSLNYDYYLETKKDYSNFIFFSFVKVVIVVYLSLFIYRYHHYHHYLQYGPNYTNHKSFSFYYRLKIIFNHLVSFSLLHSILFSYFLILFSSSIVNKSALIFCYKNS